nr:hypothetical protein [Phycicoccus sonneraticus]
MHPEAAALRREPGQGASHLRVPVDEGAQLVDDDDEPGDPVAGVGRPPVVVEVGAAVRREHLLAATEFGLERREHPADEVVVEVGDEPDDVRQAGARPERRTALEVDEEQGEVLGRGVEGQTRDERAEELGLPGARRAPDEHVGTVGGEVEAEGTRGGGAHDRGRALRRGPAPAHPVDGEGRVAQHVGETELPGEVRIGRALFAQGGEGACQPVGPCRPDAVGDRRVVGTVAGQADPSATDELDVRSARLRQPGRDGGRCEHHSTGGVHRGDAGGDPRRLDVRDDEDDTLVVLRRRAVRQQVEPRPLGAPADDVDDEAGRRVADDELADERGEQPPRSALGSDEAQAPGLGEVDDHGCAANQPGSRHAAVVDHATGRRDVAEPEPDGALATGPEPRPAPCRPAPHLVRVGVAQVAPSELRSERGLHVRLVLGQGVGVLGHRPAVPSPGPPPVAETGGEQDHGAEDREREHLRSEEDGQHRHDRHGRERGDPRHAGARRGLGGPGRHQLGDRRRG